MVKRARIFEPSQSIYIFVIACIVALTFLPGLGGEFLNWDDTSHVLESPPVQTFDVVTMFRQTVHKIYIPLTTLSFAIDHKFFGYNPFVYHLNNLVLHIINSVLVFVLAQRLGLTVFAAFVAALLFGVHPMKVESVAWVTERKDLLYAFFYLIALIVYARYLKTGSWRSFAGFILCGILSLLSKPMALSLPLILLLMDWFCRRKFTLGTVAEKLPLVIVFVPVTWITYALHARNPVNDPLEAVLMWTYSFSFYLLKFIWPDVLVPVYQIPKPVGITHDTYVVSLLLFFVVCAAVFLLRKHRWWIFSIGFYFLSIFFLLRFDPVNDIHVVADRFMYLPCLGFCFLIGLSVEGIGKHFQSYIVYGNVLVRVLLGITVLFLALKSIEQTKVWNNSISLWTHVIKHNPTSFLAYNDRAVAYNEKGQHDLAFADYSAILKFDPGNADAFYNRGLLLKNIGRYTSAIDDFTQVIRRYPHYEKAYNYRAMAYDALGQDAKALADFTRAVTVSPAYADGYMNRGNLYNHRGDLQGALADYEKTIELEPSNVRAVNNRGTIYAKMFDDDRAVAEFSKAIEMDPQHAESYYNRSVIYRRMHKFDKALEDALRSRALGAEVEDGYIFELQKAIR